MKLDIKCFLFSFVTLNTYSIVARSEFSSALVDLEPLFKTQEKVAETLDNYIVLERKRLEKVRRFMQEYDKMHQSANKDADRFLSNPVNAYLLVKRLTTDWKYVLNLIEESTNKDFVHRATKEERFPNDVDLQEASDALVRLQDIYLLNITDIANSEIAGYKGPIELSANDCFELGRHAYTEYNAFLSLPWFQETINRLNQDQFQTVNKSVLLDFAASAAYLVNKTEIALQLTKDLVNINPYHPNARNNIKLYERKLQEEALTKHDGEEEKTNTAENAQNKSSKQEWDPTLIDVERYMKLCRGEELRSPTELRKLSCRYTSNGSKYLLLQPAKEETLNLDPWIVVYHDVIRDRDIELLKEISEPMLARATIMNPKTGTLDFAKYRVSKSGWLSDDHHPRVDHISMLIEEITGLETDTAEFLQINKYGMGGHYEGHYDFRRDGDFDIFAKFGNGNRIATWLFYLNDVEAGGATVFPDLDVQVKPTKGSAGFWFNLYKNGRGDLRTKHAACPLLAGSKWVANKWLHEAQQEFRRPCSLNPLE